MATHSTPQLTRAADAWENDCGYASAVLSGIVGDLAHRLRGGYHISIEDQRSTNYSVIRKDDKAPPGTWPRDRASAIDMSMSKSDMIKCYGRVRAVWSNPNDPRRKYINAVNVWDGTGDAVRLDFVTGKSSFATADHKWHNHHERRRRYVNDPNATKAEISMYKGESIAQYLGGDDVVAVVPDGSPILRRGSTGTAVRRLQEALNFVGISLAVDGDFGPNTESRVETFQRRAKLSVDGEYGPNTAKALQREVNMAVFRDVWFTDGIPSPSADPNREDNKFWAPANIIRSNNDHARKGLAEIRADAAASRKRDEAILLAVQGKSSTSEILAKIDQQQLETQQMLEQLAEEQESRDMELMDLVRQAQSGALDAAEVVRLIGERLQAPVGTVNE